MALFIRQNEDRSKLQERLAAELQEKAKTRAIEKNTADDIEDSQYLKDTKPTTSLAWVWVVILIIAIGIIIMLMMRSI